MEVFQKKRAEQEAAYRVKVHEGKETLKKTSQVTRQYPYGTILDVRFTRNKPICLLQHEDVLLAATSV